MTQSEQVIQKIDHSLGQEERDYYSRVFAEIDNGKLISWNWTAFLFGGLWLIYRRMYITYIIYDLVFIGLAISLAWMKNHYNILGPSFDLYTIIILTFSIKVLMGLYGNFIYYEHLKRQISKGYGDVMQKYHDTFGVFLALSIPLFFAKSSQIVDLAGININFYILLLYFGLVYIFRWWKLCRLRQKG